MSRADETTGGRRQGWSEMRVRHFPTTDWDVIRAAALGRKSGRGPLTAFCTIYWYPVYAFMRRNGHSHPEAEDLTQSFFSELIAKENLATADSARGRFRAFLTGALRHFLSHERERRNARKRGGRIPHVPLDDALDDARYKLEPAELTPEQLFEKRWALALLDEALQTLRQRYAGRGKEREFDLLARHLDGSVDADDQIARDLGWSRGTARVALHRLRMRFREILRAAVGRTVSSPDEVEDEIRHLLKVLGS